MHRIRPSRAGLCAVCAGTGMMPRSAPAHLRVECASCAGVGALR